MKFNMFFKSAVKIVTLFCPLVLSIKIQQFVVSKPVLSINSQYQDGTCLSTNSYIQNGSYLATVHAKGILLTVGNSASFYYSMAPEN